MTRSHSDPVVSSDAGCRTTGQPLPMTETRSATPVGSNTSIGDRIIELQSGRRIAVSITLWHWIALWRWYIELHLQSLKAIAPWHLAA
jgi:hypothetical protein